MSVCPHCGQRAVMPTVCTPEMFEAQERRCEQLWSVYNAGYETGRRTVEGENVATILELQEEIVMFKAALADVNRQLSAATAQPGGDLRVLPASESALSK